MQQRPQLITAMTAAAVILLDGAIAFAGIPTVMNYQGRLLDEFGQPAQSGSYVIEFRVWGDETSTNGTDCLWGREYPVYSAAGMFSILLGEGGQDVGSPSPVHVGIADAFEASEACYMGMTIKTTPTGSVEAPTEVLPRQRIVTAPYAMMSGSAAALVAPDGVTKLEGTDTGVKASGDVSFDHPDGGTAKIHVHDYSGDTSTLYVDNRGSDNAEVCLRADGGVYLIPGTGKKVEIRGDVTFDGKVESVPLLHPVSGDSAHIQVFDEGNNASRLDVYNGAGGDDDVRVIAGGDVTLQAGASGILYFKTRGETYASMHETGISLNKFAHVNGGMACNDNATFAKDLNFVHPDAGTAKVYVHDYAGTTSTLYVKNTGNADAEVALTAGGSVFLIPGEGKTVEVREELKTKGTVRMLGGYEDKGIIYGHGASKSFTASTDGFVTFRSHFANYNAEIGSASFGGMTEGSSVKNETFPVAKGEVVKLTRSDGNNSGYVYMHWRPMGYRP
jgi:hypothetical protein